MSHWDPQFNFKQYWKKKHDRIERERLKKQQAAEEEAAAAAAAAAAGAGAGVAAAPAVAQTSKVRIKQEKDINIHRDSTPMQGHTVGSFVINLTGDETNNMVEDIQIIPDYTESDNEVINEMDCTVTTTKNTPELSFIIFSIQLVLFSWFCFV